MLAHEPVEAKLCCVLYNEVLDCGILEHQHIALYEHRVHKYWPQDQGYSDMYDAGQRLTDRSHAARRPSSSCDPVKHAH